MKLKVQTEEMFADCVHRACFQSTKRMRKLSIGNNPALVGKKRLRRHLPEDTQMSSKHLRRCPRSCMGPKGSAQWSSKETLARWA